MGSSGRSLVLLVASAALTTTGCRQLLGIEPIDELSDAGPDGPRDDAPHDAVVDTDGDGFLDDADNCPATENPTQDDEDLDGVGDVCDICPGHADAGQPDGDGDRVGDACDPRPTEGGDAIVLFDGFNGSTLAPWVQSGAWSVSGGDAVVASGSGVVSTLTAPEPVASADPNLTVSAKVTVGTIHPGGAQGQNVGVVTNFASSSGLGCSVGYDGGTTNGTLDLRVTGEAILLATAAHPFSEGLTGILQIRRRAKMYVCVADATPSPVTATMGSSDLSSANPGSGLRTRATSARFAWVMFVTSP